MGARGAVGSASWALFVWLAASAAPGNPAIADPELAAVPRPARIEVEVRSVPLDPDRPERDRLDGLIFRGGLSLTSNDSRFGGWSDLQVLPDGRSIIAISDRGGWLGARIELDAKGKLRRLLETRIGSMTDLKGRPMTGFQGDAEALSRQPDGGFIVAFERRHRLWSYPPAEPPFSARPLVLPNPQELPGAPTNGGVEAVLRLSDGRLLALAEDLYDREDHVGWIGDGRRWAELRYRAAEGFSPTGAAELPGGDVLVLERRFTLLGGWAARLVRVPRALVAPGARLEGAELARLEPPLTVDNFEGVAVARGSGGATLLFLISDDNFRALQRTLLLMFELPP